MGEYGYEYEDLDEYEDEEADGEEYEKEEDSPPPKEVQDYLVLRQRLKEEKREKLKKEFGNGKAISREKKNLISKSKDNYGSFFGSSQPVIAQRVIQESKSLLENPNLLAKAMKSKNMVNKSSDSASVIAKSQALGQSSKAANGMHKKVQMIKNIRDYSFLKSDDPQPQEPRKDPPRNVFAPKSEAYFAQLSERKKNMLNTTGRKVSSSRDEKKPTPVNGQVQPKVEAHRLAAVDMHKQTVSDSRKKHSASNSTLAHDRKQIQKQHSASNGTLAHDRKQIQKQQTASNGTLAHDRKQVPSNIGSGPGRPVVSKSSSSQNAGGGAEKRIGMPTVKSSNPLVPKAAPSKLQPPISKLQSPISRQSVGKVENGELRKQVLQKQSAHEELRKQKVLPKQGAPPLKQKVSQLPPKNSGRAVAVDDRSRKRPMRQHDEDDDPVKAIAMIRNLFGYNPSRYKDEDDDSDMEANFDEIEREEKRSARIARKEDEEELRKIEEEERRERLRKAAKKRKLG